MFERDDSELIDWIARELRRPVRAGPAFDARVMAAVRAERPPRARKASGLREWLLRRHTVAISPLRGLAAAAAFAAAVALGSHLVWPRAAWREGRAASSQVTRKPVQFVLVAPSASRVSLVGDFNDWDASATPLHVVEAGGVWTVTVPLPPGRYQYAFVVDGVKWLADPAAPLATTENFGSPSSAITVGGRPST